MIDQLTSFCKIIELENLTNAAKELHITQPALSMSIKKLEKQLGCKLMIRSKSGIKPTKIGRVVYEHSKRIENDFKNLRRIISEKNNKAQKNIRMGMIDNVGLTFVSKIYSDFHKRHPNLNLQIQVDNSYRLTEKVEKGSIDFAIVTKSEKKFSKKFVQSNFGEEEMSLVTSPRNFLKIKNIKSLNGMNFVSYNKESTTHKLIKKMLHDNEISVKFISYSSSPKFIAEIVKSTESIAFLPDTFVQNDILIEELKKVRIRNLRFERKFQLIYLKDTFLPGTTQEFIGELRKAF
jgi:DNA-binding transcriptional LysR family regulator